ncbi:ribosome-releasing factor 2, mitochondrial [Orussus abietinus]|uniref:ribosome-releasing factor 2, mitochondrial n=1 Tax=Orussus abietinus TaxID=222816 RepID=UPI000626965C|nr:ribosome-releasing factor 2, mitochondrial [Orussus abietinus]
MLGRKTIRISWCQFRNRALHKQASNLTIDNEKLSLSKIRNIGILAHIDAGKTTTTERMLFYSGTIHNMGEVHHGNTVTDYMDQERQRGITITSAAVTFNWKDYKFNLIDTPGHIDFTMEVEQTLGVLDGAVVILDGCAGVEAQTITVWRQADRYDIPRIMYINKMDRVEANLQANLNSIQNKLETIPLPVQLPVKDDTGLVGIVDVLTFEKVTFNKKNQGKNFMREPLTESNDGKLWETASEIRRTLTDKLTSLDDDLANVVIEQESLDEIPAQVLADSLRKVTIDRKGVPILLGSSYKNIGVQPLMNGVILYLPSPDTSKRSKVYNCFNRNLSARVFKIVHDKQRGPISFFRIYTGKLTKSQKVYNVQREKTEVIGRLYTAYADNYEEIPEINHGNIVAVTGLKSTVSGDLITSSASVANRAKESLQNINSTEAENCFTVGTNVPDPVFFCAIEPPSLSYQSALDVALEELGREDPSMRVSQDAETGQTILAGMGELHIDIIKERIKTEYGIEVDLGPLQIAYKETINSPIKDSYSCQHKIGNLKHSVNITLSLIPDYKEKEILKFDRSRESAANIAAINPKLIQAIKLGINAGFANGPRLHCPVINVGVILHWLEVGRGTSDTIVSAAVTQCIQKMLESTSISLLEPIMLVEVVSLEEKSSGVLADLSRRRSEIQKITPRGHNKVIECFVPLAELLGYSTALRIITSGNATFSIEFDHYRSMDPMDEEKAIRRITGI